MIILVMIINTLRIARYHFSQAIKIDYPYLFGGLPTAWAYPFQQILLQQLFGEDVLYKFGLKYVNVLNGLARKDMAFLETQLHPNLLKHIQFKDVKFLFYEKEKMRPTCSKSFMAFGFDSSRQDGEIFKPVQTDQKKGISTFIKKISPENKQEQIQSVPFIFGTRIVFQSLTRLHLQERKFKKQTQLHAVQFQISKNLPKSVMELKDAAEKEQIAFMKKFLTQNQDWQIGDIDFLLKGNKFDY